MKKNYNLYLTSKMISGVGDAIQEIAVLTIITYYTNSVAISGIIVTCNALVRVLCSVFAINIKPKENVKNVLSNLNFLYGGITLIFFLIFKFDSDMPYQIIIGYEVLCSLIYTFYKIYQDIIIKEVCTSNEQISKLITADNIINVTISFVGSILSVLCSLEIFLMFNSVSFFAAAYLIKLIKIKINFKYKIKESKQKFNIIQRILSFKKVYPVVFKIIIISSVVSFFYASYSVVLQAALKIFLINEKYIGLIRGIFYLVTIIFSYIVGYLKIHNFKKHITTFMIGGIMGLIIASMFNNIWFLITIIIIYAIFGGGFNTLCQIYFQNIVQQGDIPALKGIYNLLCGIAIILSGLLVPEIISEGSIYFFIGCIITTLVICLLLINTKEESKFETKK